MTGAKLIRRPSLHEEIVWRLRDMIVDETLKPGEKIPELSLCESFGVSRTPMREALKVLAMDGLVTLQANRGAWVSRLTIDELEEVFPVMGALETLAGKLACSRITEFESAEIEAEHGRMLAHFQAGDRKSYFARNERIHALILKAARNATLSAQFFSLSSRIRRARYVADMSHAGWSRAVDEHEEMFAALKARDGDRLAEVISRHLETKFETVRDWVASQNR